MTGLAVGLVTAAFLPAGPAHADQIRDSSWHLKALRVPEAHQLTQGEGVTVAVIDSGVDANHPDLRGNVLPGADAYAPGKPGTTPRSSHGTEVASLIAGHGHGPGNADGVLGIAPKAKILPVNVLDPGGRIIDPGVIGTAMKWAIGQGADVICVSLSSPFDQSQVDAVKQGGARGVVVVGAAGNTSAGDVTAGNPARIKGALGVSSIDASGAFSRTSVEDIELDLAAPGVGIPVAQPGGKYATVNGTSSAAALVAGAAALVHAKYPQDSWDMRLQRLAWTTDDRGPDGRDPQYGWGVLDVVSALTEAPEDPAAASAEPSLSPRTGPGLADGETSVEVDWLAGLYSLIAVVVLIGLIVWAVLWFRRRRRAPGPRTEPPPGSGPATGSAGAVAPGSAAGGGSGPASKAPPGAGAGPAPGAGVEESPEVWRRPAGDAPPPSGTRTDG